MGAMRAYNERITAVDTVQLGRPTAWTWRNHRYLTDQVIDSWDTSGEWWRHTESLAPDLDRPQQIRHWLIETTSASGPVRAELALDHASTVWRLIGILD